MGAFFVWLGCVPAALGDCPPPERPESVMVRQVLDGDTVRLADGRRVRLIGINAPELEHAGAAAQPFAEAARRRLQGWIAESAGRIDLVVGAQAQDRHGRLLAHAYDRRGVNLEARLLGEGLGYFVALAPNTSLADCHREAEARARHRRDGVWASPPIRAPEAVDRPGFALLRGTVTAVARNRGGLWLTLGSVRVHVPEAALAAFDSVWPADLTGTRIEVRGWLVRQAPTVTDRQARWRLRITHPAMLQVLR